MGNPSPARLINHARSPIVVVASLRGKTEGRNFAELEHFPHAIKESNEGG